LELEQDRRAKRAAIISILVNALLGIFKLVIGILSGSIAVIGDGLNSFSDLPSSILVFFGIRKARQPPDPEHPFGHGDIEALIGLIIAISLVLVAYEFGRTSLLRLIQGRYGSIGFLAIAATLVSIGAKVILARHISSEAVKARSPALEAQAWDHRSDAVSSTAVLIGVIAAYLGFEFMDPALAIVMAFFIGWIGLRVGKRNIDNLIGTLPDPELAQRIEETVGSVQGVREVHNIRLHFFGAYAEVDMHVVMDPAMTIERSHLIADEIILQTRNHFPQIKFVTVHVEPR